MCTLCTRCCQSLTAFLVAFAYSLVTMKLGSSCLPSPLWSPNTHIHKLYKNTCRSNSQQDKSVQSFSCTFQLDYSFKQPSSELLAYYATTRFRPNAALHTLCVFVYVTVVCVLTRCITSSGDSGLSPTLTCSATEQTSLSLSEPNQTVVECWAAQY